MNKNDKIYIAGHNGMVGSSVKRIFEKENYNNLIFEDRKFLDLRDFKSVKSFIDSQKPDYVIIAAAKVGGILANSNYPVEFLCDNLEIQNNLIKASFMQNSVKKICFLGSSCIYPKESIQPIKEEYLLSGKLEETNEAYALAKITGIKLLNYYKKQYGKNSISIMPCNLYGVKDSFDLKNSHVLSALVKKFVDAKNNKSDKVEVWGTGTPLREFMYVDDLASAVVFFMEKLEHEDLLNVGTGLEITIKDLANMIKKIVNFKGDIYFNTDKPDGMKRKLMDVSRMKKLGFTPKISLFEGIKKTVDYYNSLNVKK